MLKNFQKKINKKNIGNFCYIKLVFIKKYSIDIQQLIFLIEKLTYFVFLKKN